MEVPEFAFRDRIQWRAFEQLAGFSEVVENSVCKVPFLVWQDRVKKRTVEQFADIPEVVEEHIPERRVRQRIAEQIVDSEGLTCPRGVGRRTSLRVACRRGNAGRKLSLKVACPSTKSCTTVGGSAQDRAAD